MRLRSFTFAQRGTVFLFVVVVCLLEGKVEGDKLKERVNQREKERAIVGGRERERWGGGRESQRKKVTQVCVNSTE